MAYVTMFALGVAAGYLLYCLVRGVREVREECRGAKAPYKIEGCGGSCKCKTNKETANVD